MPGTRRFVVPAGTTSAVFQVGPLENVMAGPRVLGGTVLLEFSFDGRTRWTPWQFGTLTGAQTFRPPVARYVRITAATQDAVVFVADLAGANGVNVTQMINITGPCASSSGTAEQAILTVRIPPLYLPPNFTLEFALSFSMTNNANAKTPRVRWGGVAGSALYVAPSLASQLNHNLQGWIAGRDGMALIGGNPGASGGIGNSTTAQPTASVDYINQETELNVTVVKATAGDAFVLENAVFKLY